MDKDALGLAERRCDCAGRLIETSAHEDHCAVYWPERLLDETREILGANGYVVMPRHEEPSISFQVRCACCGRTTERTRIWSDRNTLERNLSRCPHCGQSDKDDSWMFVRDPAVGPTREDERQ